MPLSLMSSVKIRTTLETLNRLIREATETLSSGELAQELDGALHDADRLPDRDLEALARSTVDAMEALQLRLIPSMTLLADGFFGYMNSKAMAAVVEAKVPDVLHSHGSLTAEELGPFVRVQPTRLTQLLDALVNNGIFSYDESSEKFSNNRCSTLLRRDHWTKWHLWADLYPNFFFDVSRSIPAAIRTGETRYAAQIEYGTDLSLFEYLASQGKSEYFHRVLGAGAVAMSKGLTIDYPWEELNDEIVVDLGAGSGDFLASVLRQNPSLRGVVVDLKHIVDIVSLEIAAGGGTNGRFVDVADRMSAKAGDFFGDIPAASVYTIKWCLHNWMDNDVVRILRNTRARLIPSPVARFIIFESTKRPGRSGRLARYADILMMMTVNGRERTEGDWKRLAGLAGWKVHRVIDIRNSWASAIDLRPI
ncbi:unnamed protein product [Colletotrichum noveboracense]|uniref:O-methyltransferase domain-containing protein n=1 Tax=Colletotrichum noveboracense TaxID=2664923 RepID=A0A9W4RR63_9PEZI|nr:hypothetical protein CBS470a_009043 [Colletotrichum nupharicola]KAJ0285647.1 hypothetical protein COL940_003493 [Colletotrichum noveboracense]CAI0645816.1 unnamed protein product [Colletotrichum noveboracense]